MAVSLILPFSVLAQESPATVKFDRNNDGIINRADWRYMKEGEKRTYVRMSLDEIGESPSAIVFKDKSREQLLFESLEKIYGK